MSNHYDEMRVSPDRSKAEQLRQDLHARLMGTSSGDHLDRSAPRPHVGSDRNERVVPMAELAPLDRVARERSNRHPVLVVAAAAVAVVLAAAAVGFASRLGDRQSLSSTAPTSSVPTSPHTGVDGSPKDSCPLTAEDISDVLGVTVTGPESSRVCYFSSGPGIVPSASFGYLGASSCTSASLREEGYLDSLSSIGPVDGLGVDAYAQRSGLGVTVLVCDGQRPFDVHVEFIGDDQAAAVALAQIVLDD